MINIDETMRKLKQSETELSEVIERGNLGLAEALVAARYLGDVKRSIEAIYQLESAVSRLEARIQGMVEDSHRRHLR